MTQVPNSPAPRGTADEVFGGVNLLTNSLRELDERGLVLSLAAFAEEALGDLLKSFMRPSEAANQLLDGFNAPLGTFSSRIKAAEAFGLITKDQFQDLERLRKMRNEFAHSWKPIDFKKPKLAALIDALCFSRINAKYPNSPIEKVRSSLSGLLVELRSTTHQIEEKSMRARLIGNHLMPGFAGDFETQVNVAQTELRNTIERLGVTQGKEHDFFVEQLNRLKDRFTVLARPDSTEQKEVVNALHEELNTAIERYAA